jgi:exopolysaccharide biosynthesis predicted pyruvyltransferase EpsI
LTDLYPVELELKLKALEAFKSVPCIIFPQTYNVHSTRYAQKLKSALEKHDDLLILARDVESEERLKSLLGTCAIHLFPDVVTTLIGRRKYDRHSPGIIQLCLRNDEESVNALVGQRDLIKQSLSALAGVDVTDTESSKSFLRIRLSLERTVWSAIDSFAMYSVTVTDRYHGTIFSMIAGVPAVVLASRDHKLTSGYQWFENLGYNSVVELANQGTPPEIIAGMANRLYQLKDVEMPSTFPFPGYDQLGAWVAAGHAVSEYGGVT